MDYKCIYIHTYMYICYIKPRNNLRLPFSMNNDIIIVFIITSAANIYFSLISYVKEEIMAIKTVNRLVCRRYLNLHDFDVQKNINVLCPVL